MKIFLHLPENLNFNISRLLENSNSQN